MFLMLSGDNQFKCQRHGRCHIFLAVAAPAPDTVSVPVPAPVVDIAAAYLCYLFTAH